MAAVHERKRRRVVKQTSSTNVNDVITWQCCSIYT